jgi:protein-S-isoprenylcysteine O-methyltransferase Ste14
MGRFIRFSFGLLSYFFFFASFLYLIGFVHNLFVPRSIDVGPEVSTTVAVVINLLLIMLFGLQHSIMARPAFKTVLTRFWPESIERSLYVAMSAVALCIMYFFWRPMPEMIWSVELEWLRMLLWGLAGLGWIIVLLSTFLLNHFELFGLHQIWVDLRNRTMPSAIFREPFFYKFVRHPIYTGFLLAFWMTPDMSQGHLLFSFGMTIYILVGIRYEERDLKANLGEVYIEYSRRVGMVIPGIGKN